MRGLGPPMQHWPGPPCSTGQDIEHDWSNMMKMSSGMFSPSYAVPTQPSSSGAGSQPLALLVPPTPVTGPPEPLLFVLPMLTALLPTALLPDGDPDAPSSSSPSSVELLHAAARNSAVPTAIRVR